MRDLQERADHLTMPFWEAAARGSLVRPVCDACGRSFFTPQWACPHCHSEQWDYVPSDGRGVVYSATVVHRGPDETWATPYVLAVVDLDEGWTMLSRLAVDPAAEPNARYLGRRVSAVFVDEERPPYRRLPVFALAEQA